MKNIILAYISISLLIILTACPGPEPGPAEVNSKKLTTGAWKMRTVSVDGTDQTDVFAGLTITFSKTSNTKGSFTTSNGGPVWPPSGTWEFTTGTATELIRQDGLDIIIEDLTETNLTLKLTWTKDTIGPGRLTSVSGVNRFTFSH